MAQTCQDTQIAARLRMIAADYLDCAGRQDFPTGQQVQSDKKASR